METEFIDVNLPFLANEIKGNYHVKANELIIRFPGARIRFYRTEPNQEPIKLFLENKTEGTIRFSFWLNTHFLDFISFNDSAKINLPMPVHYQ